MATTLDHRSPPRIGRGIAQGAEEPAIEGRLDLLPGLQSGEEVKAAKQDAAEPSARQNYMRQPRGHGIFCHRGAMMISLFLTIVPCFAI